MRKFINKCYKLRNPIKLLTQKIWLWTLRWSISNNILQMTPLYDAFWWHDSQSMWDIGLTKKMIGLLVTLIEVWLRWKCHCFTIFNVKLVAPTWDLSNAKLVAPTWNLSELWSIKISCYISTTQFLRMRILKSTWRVCLV